MTGLLKTLAQVATMEHRLTTVAETIKKHDTDIVDLKIRLTRLETLVAVARADGTVLRIAPPEG